MNADDPKLTAYALGELSPAESAAVEAELCHSPEQQREVEEIRRCARWLSAGLQAEPGLHLTATQQTRLLKPLSTMPRQPETAKVIALARWQFWIYSGALAAAACLVMMLVLPGARKGPSESAQPHPKVAVNPSKISETNLANKPPELRIPPESTPVQAVNTPATALEPVKASNTIHAKIDDVPITNNTPILAYQNQAKKPPPPSPVLTSKLQPLLLQLPIPAFMGTPTDIPLGDRIERPSDKPRPAVMVLEGTTNVALHQKVTSSDLAPIAGSLDLITDGDKEASDTSYVELHRKAQWVQIDLGREYAIQVMVIWHAHNTPQVYHGVVVQLADDADFTRNVRTVFNNDMDNANGLGTGTDKEYFENYEGRLIPVPGLPARYVRAYSRGSTYSALNRYTEIEVYAVAVE